MCAGMRLSPGTYHVSAKVEDGFHVVFTCDKDRMQPFEIDFSGVFLYFTVCLHPASAANLLSAEYCLAFA